MANSLTFRAIPVKYLVPLIFGVFVQNSGYPHGFTL